MFGGDSGDHVVYQFDFEFQFYLEVCLLEGELIDNKLIQVCQAFAI